MYELVRGMSLLDDESEMLVNPVNCRGISGAGLAKAFKVRFPVNEQLYRSACLRHELRLGEPFITVMPTSALPIYVCNFPTKDDWRYPSQLAWIEAGLRRLDQLLQSMTVATVALPALGCGLGGLDWAEVEGLIIARLDRPQRELRIYPPQPVKGEPGVDRAASRARSG